MWQWYWRECILLFKDSGPVKTTRSSRVKSQAVISLIDSTFAEASGKKMMPMYYCAFLVQPQIIEYIFDFIFSKMIWSAAYICHQNLLQIVERNLSILFYIEFLKFFLSSVIWSGSRVKPITSHMSFLISDIPLNFRRACCTFKLRSPSKCI
jgi:hypothetical protein